MNLSKSAASLMAAVALAAFACDRPEPVSEQMQEERSERVEQTADEAEVEERETTKAFYQPLRPPHPDDGPTFAIASPTEAAGLAVGKEALEEAEIPEVKGTR
jgi:hypothetical protein